MSKGRRGARVTASDGLEMDVGTGRDTLGAAWIGKHTLHSLALMGMDSFCIRSVGFKQDGVYIRSLHSYRSRHVCIAVAVESQPFARDE